MQPLHARPDPAGWTLNTSAVDEQCRRLRDCLKAYGPIDRRGFVTLLLARLQRMIDFLTDGAAAGDERLRELIHRGDADLYARDRDHIEANREALSRAVGTPPPGGL